MSQRAVSRYQAPTAAWKRSSSSSGPTRSVARRSEGQRFGGLVLVSSGDCGEAAVYRPGPVVMGSDGLHLIQPSDTNNTLIHTERERCANTYSTVRQADKEKGHTEQSDIGICLLCRVEFVCLSFACFAESNWSCASGWVNKIVILSTMSSTSAMGTL